jgi:DNA-binding transcriptional regulator GbsR (MarR family)
MTAVPDDLEQSSYCIYAALVLAGPMTPRELVAETGYVRQTVSAALGELHDAGLVERTLTTDGRERRYRIDAE